MSIAPPLRTRPLTPPGPWITASRDHRNLHLRFHARLFYRLSQLFGRLSRFCALRIEVVRPQAIERPGGHLVACTHLSYLEPFVLGLLYNRQIDWVTRMEFYSHWISRWILPRMGAFPVNRFGVPVSTIRTAIARVKAGRIVAIFPEGGVCTGDRSACRGARVKQGACLVAQRTGAPIVPCVIVGTHALNCVAPWLPFRRGKLWVAFGEPLFPIVDTQDPKAARRAMAARLEQRFASLYQELLQQYHIDDHWVP